LLLQRSAIRLAGPATEIDDVKRRHAQTEIELWILRWHPE
jgi:hypothetical protein